MWDMVCISTLPFTSTDDGLSFPATLPGNGAKPGQARVFPERQRDCYTHVHDRYAFFGVRDNKFHRP